MEIEKENKVQRVEGQPNTADSLQNDGDPFDRANTPSIALGLESTLCQLEYSGIRSRLSDIILGHSTRLYEEQLKSVSVLPDEYCLNNSKLLQLQIDPIQEQQVSKQDVCPSKNQLIEKEEEIQSNNRSPRRQKGQTIMDKSALVTVSACFCIVKTIAVQEQYEVINLSKVGLQLRKKHNQGLGCLLMGCLSMPRYTVMDLKFDDRANTYRLRLSEGNADIFDRFAAILEERLWNYGTIECDRSTSLKFWLVNECKIMHRLNQICLADFKKMNKDEALMKNMKAIMHLRKLLSSKWQLSKPDDSAIDDDTCSIEDRLFDVSRLWQYFVQNNQEIGKAFNNTRLKLLERLKEKDTVEGFGISPQSVNVIKVEQAQPIREAFKLLCSVNSPKIKLEHLKKILQLIGHPLCYKNSQDSTTIVAGGDLSTLLYVILLYGCPTLPSCLRYIRAYLPLSESPDDIMLDVVEVATDYLKDGLWLECGQPGESDIKK